MTGFFFSCAILSLASANAVACKCPESQYSLSEQFANASMVFVGTTTADPSVPGNAGATITFQVSRPLKGVPAGTTTIAVDPKFETDCTAPYVAKAKLLVFAYSQPSGVPATGACSVRAAEPVSIGGHEQQPSPEVIKLLQSGA